MSRTILLNPGPVTLTERVRQSLLRPDMCHREADFAAMLTSIKERLRSIYTAPAHEAVLLTGSGTAAVEAMLATFAPRRASTLVATNGVYGERMAAMLAAQGKPHRTLEGAWTEGLDLPTIEAALHDPDITHVAAVHHETTTGRLNEAHALADLCARHGRALLLDAVSSFGGEDVPVAQCLAVAATANKCLHGVPGVAFVMADTAALEHGDPVSPTVYLDLRRYHREQQHGFSPFTMAVHACFALDEALTELSDEGGWAERRTVYRKRSARVREALAVAGLEPLVPDGQRASMLTAWPLPNGLPYEALHAAMRKAGFVIYAGQGALAGHIFRIATMGAIGDDDLARLVEALRSVCDTPCR
ncbi:MAG: aminotransferase class V-fold PLP-dependent enzyme [Proteobacteria bacterium]|nr:aminotransferase class V-fold PLP-dependent enzyme [Pseudomonadota bacterium]